MLFNNTIDISEVFSGQGTWMAKERDSKVRSFEGRSFKGIMARRAINKLILIVILLIITWINVSQIISFDRVAECVQDPGKNPREISQQEIEVEKNRTIRKLADDGYFDGYAHYGIHEEMLKDEIRTLTYRDSIYKNAHLFKGKTVLDVGSGTGILSMFAAKAGAARVIAIERSGMVEHARKIVAKNQLDHVITFVHGKVEEVTLPVNKVDIIISEWMGYALLFESMLQSVLFARDKWLNPGGYIFPDACSLYITAIEDRSYRENSIDWWHNVYGFDMTPLKNVVIGDALVDSINADKIVTDAYLLKDFDLYTVREEDLRFRVPFQLECMRDDYINALTLYFTVEFKASTEYIGFSTAPDAPYTHWKQTTFFFEKLDIQVQTGEKLTGTLLLAQDPVKPRSLNFNINVMFNGELSNMREYRTFRM